MCIFVINGPFAVGKSTVARLLHREFPLALMIAVDDIRRLYNRFKEFQRDSLLLAEELSRAMARVAASNGRVAIVEGVKAFEKQLEPWNQLGMELGVPVHHVLLWSSKDTVLKRAAARGIAPGSMLSLDLVCWAWDNLDNLRQNRSDIIEFSTEALTPEEIVRALRDRVATTSR